MGLITTIKRWIEMIFKSQAEKDFKIDVIESPVMEAITQKCANIYRGTPPW